MDASRARQLRDAADGKLHLLADVHHEVGKLVDDDNDVRQFRAQLARGRLFAGFARLLLCGDFCLDLCVVLPDIACARLAEHLKAPLHFRHSPR